jgi:uncharacterized protein (TIGR03083 family)
MADDTKTWAMIHAERAALADLFEAFTLSQWATSSTCDGWTVHVLGAHILAGAENDTVGFLSRMAANGFRFNTMIDRDARRLGELAPAEIVTRLRARTTTTNRPPAPAMAMLGEAVVHGADVRTSLGLAGEAAADASIACLDMYTKANFPVGGKKRISGLRLNATDVGWTHGDGPAVSGPATSVLLAMTGRRVGLDGLTGDGVATLRGRFAA